MYYPDFPSRTAGRAPGIPERPAAEPMPEAAWRIGEQMLEGVLLEVATPGKPGLVCPESDGSHTDMSLRTFMAGSAAIAPAFSLCAAAGFMHDAGLPALLSRLRAIGRPYEARLLAATKGVNTQRGILFAGGLTAGAAGYCAARQSTDALRAQEVCAALASMTSGIVARELVDIPDQPDRPLTAGETLFKRYGATGIRGEVENGLPSVLGAGLPALNAAFERGADLSQAFLHSLIALMACVEDTTVLWRADWDALLAMRAAARGALEAGSVFTQTGRERIEALRRQFTSRRLSPGGCADMLAMTIALYLMEHGQFPVAIR